MEQKNGAATASTILGIVSLVLAIIGGITFGVIGAAIALILGIVAVVLGINAKKQTGGTKGQAGFVCGLIGIIFAVIFAVGCSICGAVESSSTKTSYTCSDCRQSGARTVVLAPFFSVCSNRSPKMIKKSILSSLSYRFFEASLLVFLDSCRQR